jgi:hypothetical protein|tara:strand:- start:120 stop:1133 length:1014 start_codon:yes stop_codon:yes gene_type:complete
MPLPSSSPVKQVNPVPWANAKDRNRYIDNDRSKFLTAEDYYNNKYPKRNVTTSKVDPDRKNESSLKPYTLYNVDVRTFLNSKNFRLPKIRANPNYDDNIALEGLRWVTMKPIGKNIKYSQLNDSGEIIPGLWQSNHRIRDIIDDGSAQSKIESAVLSSENWSFSYQTLGRMNGDCEDGAILLYDILRNAGVPAWKLRLNAGWVTTQDIQQPLGGHVWLSYYVESQFWKSKRDDRWVILDWCYGDLDIEIKPEDRIRHTDDKRYGPIDYSFNEEYTWSLGKLRSGLDHFGDCPAITANDFYWQKQCICGSKQCTCGLIPCKCKSKKCSCTSNECNCPR